jgi:hypothetical protein
MVFAPVIQEAVVHSTGTIHAAVVGGQDGSGIDLFFMENVFTEGKPPLRQVIEFVTKLLDGAGFDKFEFIRGCDGCGISTDVITAHPALEPTFTTF